MNKVVKINYYEMIFAVIIIIVSILFVYLPTINYNFLFDDKPNITNSVIIRHGNLSKFFMQNTRWICNWLNSIYYHFFKLEPYIYRFGNIFFHILVTITAFYIIFLLVKKRSSLSENAYFIALLTSILFALHPVQTQTISYIIHGQGESLSALFTLLIILTFLAYCNSKNFFKCFWFLLITLLSILSTGTKEIAIVSPFLVLFVDWFFLAEGNLQKLKSNLLVHIHLLFTFFATYAYFLKPEFFLNIFKLNMQTHCNIGNTLTINPDQKINTFNFFISQFKVILHYIQIFIYPFNLNVDYGWKLVKGFFDIDCILPLIILVIFAFYILNRFIKNKIDLYCFSIIWFFVCLLPRASIIPSTELVADYKTYLASLGIFFAIALIINRVASGIRFYKINLKSYQLSYAFIFFISLTLGWSSLTRNKVWSSGKTFWKNVIANETSSARAYNNYATELISIKKYEKALKYLDQAISLDANYCHAWINKAYIYAYLDDIDKAIEATLKSLEIQPYSSEAYNNLATYYLKKNNFEKAEISLLKAIEINPTYGRAFYQLGLIKREIGNKQEALTFLKKACQLNFDNDLGYKAYGELCSELNLMQEAVQAYQNAHQCNPNSKEITNELGLIYIKIKDFKKAQEIYEKLDTQIPSDNYIITKLAKCYYKQNKFKEAYDKYMKVYQNNISDSIIGFRMFKYAKSNACFIQANNILTAIIKNETNYNYKQKAKSLLLKKT